MHRTSMLVKSIFPELHTRNLLLARLSSLQSAPMIFICAYIPPDLDRRKQALEHLGHVMEFLIRRYSIFSVLAFADLNADLMSSTETGMARKTSAFLKQYGLEAHSSTSHTRTQGSKASHLDYFITKGVEIRGIKVGERFGKSDHKILTCDVSGARPVLKRKNMIHSKSKAAAMVSQMFDIGNSEPIRVPALEFFRELGAKLQRCCVVPEPRSSNYFKAIALVEKELRDPASNWRKIRSELLANSRTNYAALQDKIRSLLREHKMRDYHKIVGGLLNLRKSTMAVNDIEDPNDPGQAIADEEKLNDLLLTKYSTTFASDLDRAEFKIGNIRKISVETLEDACSIIAKGKGLGMDSLPDTILSIENTELKAKLLELINKIFTEYKIIPSPFRNARLHLLNKLKCGLPTTEDLRPIMISSPIVKVVEAVALIKLKEKLVDKISTPQVGFLPTLGTQIHIFEVARDNARHSRRRTLQFEGLVHSFCGL